MPTVLITGASRGIGLELTRQYAGRGWHVIATCRKPKTAEALLALAKETKSVEIMPLDVADHGQVDVLAEWLSGRPIDLLINNAGIGERGIALGAIDYGRWRTVIETNLLGPVKLSEALLPNVLAGKGKKIISISSTLGSIQRSDGGNYAYRTSKAALNMAMRSLARDLAGKGITVTLLSPGIVDTDFTRDLKVPAKISPRESVSGMIGIIDKLTPADAGKFIRYNGDAVEW